MSSRGYTGPDNSAELYSSWTRPSESVSKPGFEQVGDENMITTIKNELKFKQRYKDDLNSDLKYAKLYNYKDNNPLSVDNLSGEFNDTDIEIPDDKLTPKNIAYIIKNYQFRDSNYNDFKTIKDYFRSFFSNNPLDIRSDGTILYNPKILHLELLPILVKALVVQKRYGISSIPAPTSGGSRRRKRRTNKRKRTNKRRRSNKRRC